jgi:hypothetical protein
MSGKWVYVLVALALIVFGIAGLFSIGAPFLLTGIVMLICLSWRRDLALLLPALSAVWAFTLGYILVAPLGCSSSAVSPGHGLVRGGTVCNGILFDYSGGGSYSPSYVPALLVGLGAALGAAILVSALLRRRLTQARV